MKLCCRQTSVALLFLPLTVFKLISARCLYVTVCRSHLLSLKLCCRQTFVALLSSLINLECTFHLFISVTVCQSLSLSYLWLFLTKLCCRQTSVALLFLSLTVFKMTSARCLYVTVCLSYLYLLPLKLYRQTFVAVLSSIY